MPLCISEYNRLTISAWRTIQRDCKKTIRVLTDSRRRLERRHKSEKISYLYDEYCASLPAREWATLPSSLRIVEITDCVKLIDQAKMDDLTPEYLNPLFSRCISEWKVKQKKSIFPDSWEPFEEEHSLLPETSDLRKLDLAKATYTCGCFHYTNTSGRVDGMSLVGWEEVVAHRERHIDQYQELEFNHSGSRTVVEIINLLGLNEETTTPEQLDILDHRFLCECCLTRRNLSTRRAYSWRECVSLYKELLEVMYLPVIRSSIPRIWYTFVITKYIATPVGDSYPQKRLNTSERMNPRSPWTNGHATTVTSITTHM